MAEVYDAFDERLARPVAIKLLRPAQAPDQATRGRFEREARAAAALSHPSVVAVYDSGEDRGDVYLVMERLPGETLADRIRSGPVDPDWLVGIADDVLAALGAAHAAGIVHRDVKPANILLAADGRAKVADFGIAKAYRRDDGMPSAPGGPTPVGEASDGGDLTVTGMVLGTVAYIAPEQVEGEAATPRSDLYSLGVVLYEALTARKPYVGTTPVAQARAAAAGGAPDVTELRPDVPEGLAAVVRRSMARRPEERYPSAEAMRRDLAERAARAAPRGPDPTMLLGAELAPPAADPARPDTAELPAATIPAALLAGGATEAWAPTGVAGALAAPVALASPLPPGPSRPEPERRRSGLAALVGVAALVVAGIVVAALLLGGHQRPAATKHRVTRRSPSTATTLDPAAQALLADAESFDAIGTSGARSLATLLDEVARSSPSAMASRADAAAASAESLLGEGAISPAEYDEAITDLGVVPGFSAPTTTTSAASTTSTTTASTTTTTASTTTTTASTTTTTTTSSGPTTPTKPTTTTPPTHPSPGPPGGPGGSS